MGFNFKHIRVRVTSNIDCCKNRLLVCGEFFFFFFFALSRAHSANAALPYEYVHWDWRGGAYSIPPHPSPEAHLRQTTTPTTIGANFISALANML